MEIEVKAKLPNKTAVVERLQDMGCTFSPPKKQDDMVWTKKTGSLEEFLSNDAFFRIRIQSDGNVILTAKSPKAKTGNESLVKREHEVVVSSAEEARGILELLGLQEAVRVVKVRQVTSYKGFEICIDEIEGLGSFIELERMGESDEAQQIQKDMLAFLQELGVSPDQQVMKGYDILMLEKLLG